MQFWSMERVRSTHGCDQKRCSKVNEAPLAAHLAEYRDFGRKPRHPTEIPAIVSKTDSQLIIQIT